MPAMITHMLCGQKSITISGCDDLRKIINKNQHAFNMGTEGPDPFMYYAMLPWDKHEDAERIRSYSDVIHYGKPTAFFKTMLEECKNSGDETKIAYTAGFISHHALDSTAHPYVYYETGSSKLRAGKAHQMFEKQLDYALLTEFGLVNKEFKPHKKIQLNDDQLKTISEFMADSLNKTFAANTNATEVKYAYTGMYKGEAVLFDLTGLRKKLIIAIAKMVGAADLAESMITPTSYDESLDVLNNRGEIWYEPTDENISHSEKFMQIFDSTCLKTAKRLEAFEAYLKGTVELENVLELIGDGSYENGTVDKKMYFYKADHKNVD